jgi:choline dehydrogenase-like flavoprotein
MEYDDIIVGGGSAGAVLAARLSEEPARRVLLVEAGPDYATLESTPEDLQDGWRMSLRTHDWGQTAEAVPGRVIPYPRGRVVGGSSAVNATIALRGVPADYDRWAALGNDEWSWAKVLPSFRRLEDDPEGASALHGRGGPVAICRWRLDELIPIQRAFFEVCRRLGFPEVTDHNHPEASGVGPFPQNRQDRLVYRRRSPTCCRPGSDRTSPSARTAWSTGCWSTATERLGWRSQAKAIRNRSGDGASPWPPVRSGRQRSFCARALVPGPSSPGGASSP